MSSSTAHPVSISSAAATPSPSGVMTMATSNPPASASSAPSVMPPSSSNLVSEFESAYAEMLATLTQEDEFVSDKKRRTDAMRKQEEEKMSRFMALARHLETFFLQKRLLIHSHRPECILREDSNELRQVSHEPGLHESYDMYLMFIQELVKKDELIRSHYEKLAQWQAMLQEMDTLQQHNTADASKATKLGSSGSGGQMPVRGALPMTRGVAPGAPTTIPGIGAPQGVFIPGNNYRMVSQQHRN